VEFPKKVLIVEDDKQISLALGVRLRASGYEVLQAFDGLQGFSQIMKHRPDVVVLDVSVPAGGGFSVAERMRDSVNLASIPIVFMTASKKPELYEQSKRFGSVGFLEKPFDAELLLALIRKATGELPPPPPAPKPPP
jgi:two-component system chemotaxis response regulator CheY